MTPARILVIDDNPMNVELVRFVLESAGLACEVVHDAGRALEHIAASRPDLVLMDIQMPGTDGLELTRQIKADPATRDIIVVAFTAYAMKGDEARMRSAGCDGYLSKPIDVASFADRVRTYLRAEPG